MLKKKNDMEYDIVVEEKKYKILIKKGEQSGYVAVCPALPGCISQGRTRKSVLKNIKEAIELYIECLRDYNSVHKNGECV